MEKEKLAEGAMRLEFEGSTEYGYFPIGHLLSLSLHVGAAKLGTESF